jgi:Tfp pilus assembly protein PilZ
LANVSQKPKGWEQDMGHASVDSDRRRYDREACALWVDVDDYENAYTGQLYNLGLGGACIKNIGEARFHHGQELFLTIPYRKKEDYLIIKGKIAWQKNEAIGVEFLREPVSH